MYCIYVSKNGENIQKVINNNNEVVRADDIQTLMLFAKAVKNYYIDLNVSIVDESSGAIIVDYQ